MLLSLPRLARSPVLLLLGVFLASLFLLHTFQDSLSFSPLFRGPEKPSSPLLEEQRAFWRSFSPHLTKNAPACDPIVHYEGGDLSIGYDPTDHEVVRPDHLNATDEQLSALRSTHAAFVNHLKTENYTLPVTPNSRGIVTTAGGKYLPVAVVSIRMLRETGSSLPVEVFLASADEWDEQICSKVFPSMNAKCVVLEDIVKDKHRGGTLSISHYQYKIMSIVFSSFDDILFLDADAFPIFDPNQYFESEPFRMTGMIRWPDFWFPSESPLFFQIAGIPEPKLWDRSATESGELFYSKKRHTKSLLLALYYNYYGPDFYYPLQSQGAPGEGDKETFLWSAIVFDEDFYTVKKSVQAIGYLTKTGDWRGSAMVQFDPIQDFEIQSNPSLTYAEKYSTRITPVFVHANFPKFNPATIFEAQSFGAAGPTRDSDGVMRRVWFDDLKTSLDFFSFDVERRLWLVIRDIACTYEGTFSSWSGEKDVCQKATAYWNTMYPGNG